MSERKKRLSTNDATYCLKLSENIRFKLGNLLTRGGNENEEKISGINYDFMPVAYDGYISKCGRGYRGK